MNVEKHECSLLEVFSDVGSTPTASTISSSLTLKCSVERLRGHLFPERKYKPTSWSMDPALDSGASHTPSDWQAE